VAGHRGFLLREAISLLLTFSGFLGRVGSVLILSFVWNMGGRVEFGAGSIINDTYPHFEWLSHSFVLECGHVGGEPGLGDRCALLFRGWWASVRLIFLIFLLAMSCQSKEGGSDLFIHLNLVNRDAHAIARLPVPPTHLLGYISSRFRASPRTQARFVTLRT
jgi:hypothetical protein